MSGKVLFVVKLGLVVLPSRSSASVGGVLRSLGGVEDGSMDGSCVPRVSFRVTHRPCAETLPAEERSVGLVVS